MEEEGQLEEESDQGIRKKTEGRKGIGRRMTAGIMKGIGGGRGLGGG